MGWQIPADNNIETTNWIYGNPDFPNDGDTDTSADWYHTTSLQWSDWLEFYLAAPILCDKVRYMVETDAGGEGNIEIQGYWNGQWNNIYTGLYTQWSFIEKVIPSGPKVVQNLRVRMRDNGEANSFSSIYEFQADAVITARPLIDGCLAAGRKGLI